MNVTINIENVSIGVAGSPEQESEDWEKFQKDVARAWRQEYWGDPSKRNWYTDDYIESLEKRLVERVKAARREDSQ